MQSMEGTGYRELNKGNWNTGSFGPWTWAWNGVRHTVWAGVRKGSWSLGDGFEFGRIKPHVRHRQRDAMEDSERHSSLLYDYE